MNNRDVINGGLLDDWEEVQHIHDRIGDMLRKNPSVEWTFDILLFARENWKNVDIWITADHVAVAKKGHGHLRVDRCSCDERPGDLHKTDMEKIKNAYKSQEKHD